MYHATSQSSIHYLYYAQQNDEGTWHTAQRVWCKKNVERRRKRATEILSKSPNEGGNKELICCSSPGEPCEAKWTPVLHLTVNPQGFRCFNLPDVGFFLFFFKKPKPLIDFINFVAFSQREGLSACVFYVCHELPQGNGALLKGFWGRIKAFLSRGGRNTIVMTCCHPCMHLPTGALSSRPRHWGRKPAAPAVCYQSAWDRFSLLDISEGGHPLCPLLSALVFSEVATLTTALVAYLLSERMREGRRL